MPIHKQETAVEGTPSSLIKLISTKPVNHADFHIFIHSSSGH